MPVKVWAASVRAMVASVLGKVIVVASVPANVIELLTVTVFPSAIVKVDPVAGAVRVTLFTEAKVGVAVVATSCPIEKVVSVNVTPVPAEYVVSEPGIPKPTISLLAIFNFEKAMAAVALTSTSTISPSFILAEVTASSANLASVTALEASFSVVTLASFIVAVSIASAAKSAVTMVPSAILAEVIEPSATPAAAFKVST